MNVDTIKKCSKWRDEQYRDISKSFHHSVQETKQI